MISQKMNKKASPALSVELKNGSKIVVVGAGPAGCFFAMRILKTAEQHGVKIKVILVEKKSQLKSDNDSCISTEGCNFCAGGISPRLVDVLLTDGMPLPKEIIKNTISAVIIHNNWKNIELRVPKERQMFAVFRGAKPKGSSNRYANFDSFLLTKAVEHGAELIVGEVNDFRYSDDKKPIVSYTVFKRGEKSEESIEADFVVFASGVNPLPGMDLKASPLFNRLQQVMPKYVPPKVRKALIFELEVDDSTAHELRDEIYFIEYGSKEVDIELSSIVPKGLHTTVVLLGKSIDRSRSYQNINIMKQFLELSHIKKILPARSTISTVCTCNPNMTVSVARHPYSHRVACIGDMVYSRLYKDGILSANITASALVECMFSKGVDAAGLQQGFEPILRKLRADNRYGKIVFLINRMAFKNSLLSRIFYQAVLSERKTKPQRKRILERVLWKFASGDDDYKNIFFAMIHPMTLLSIIKGGLLVSCRNYLTELLFGLKWRGFGRYPTGIFLEDFEERRCELIKFLPNHHPEESPEFERMYSIRIRAPKDRIFDALGTFGDLDRKYFKPRFVTVHRIDGKANELGSVIQYDLPLKFMSFRIALEKFERGHYLLYRIMDGFAKGGVLIFDIENHKKAQLLSIYVAYNFQEGDSFLTRLFWGLFERLFPQYMHDVLWNHSLCKFKDIVEFDG